MAKAIHQILPSFSQWDAIGNEAAIIQERLRRLGHVSEIFCDQGFAGKSAKNAKYLMADLANADKETKVIYHYSVGSQLTNAFTKLACKKILRYHNITPGQFFARPDELAARHACNLGRVQMPLVVEAADLLLSDSRYNAQELEPFNGGKKAKVISVLRDFRRLTTLSPDQRLAHDLTRDATKNVLFVGRVSPNKSQHDILQILAMYKAKYKQRARVILAGGFFSKSYQSIIQKFAAGLGLTFARQWDFSADVICIGSVTDDQLATLYRTSDVFLSTSEHEGFGVPLVESMYFDLPVVAHRAAAVPEILGDGAFLMNKFEWDRAVETLHQALSDEGLRKKEISRCQSWRANFDVESSWKAMLHEIESC